MKVAGGQVEIVSAAVALRLAIGDTGATVERPVHVPDAVQDPGNGYRPVGAWLARVRREHFEGFDALDRIVAGDVDVRHIAGGALRALREEEVPEMPRRGLDRQTHGGPDRGRGLRVPLITATHEFPCPTVSSSLTTSSSSGHEDDERYIGVANV